MTYSIVARDAMTGQLGVAVETCMFAVGSAVATADKRWAGVNRGGWVNAEYDRFYDIYMSSLDRAERNQYVVQLLKLVSEEAPLYPLYYNHEFLAHARERADVWWTTREELAAWYLENHAAHIA